MKPISVLLVLACLSTLIAPLSTVRAQGTTFTYQGRLNDGANPANGRYDLRFALYDALAVGSQQGNLLTNTATAVSNGLFTVTLDFGNQFPGANRWLEIAVRTNGNGAFSTLVPRQQLTPTPYAVFSANAGSAATATTAISAVSAGSVAAANIAGALTTSQLPASVILNGASGVNLSGTFIGNGAGLTGIDLQQINTSGAITLLNHYLGFVLSSSPVVGSAPISVTSADVNGDGKPDLICANYYGGNLTVLTNNGNGGFGLSSSPAVGLHPWSVVAADVNGDGKVDLICANYDGGNLTVLTNNGSGGFGLSATLAVASNPNCVIAVDVNGDGKVDLVAANNDAAGNMTIYTNNGTGGFALAPSPAAGSYLSAVTAADVNGDGKVDLIAANYNAHKLTVMTNNGAGIFGVAGQWDVGNSPYSLTSADVNGDGKPDLISGNYSDGTLTVLTNNGNGGFALASSPGVGNSPYWVTAADVNGDGKMDLISANYGGATLTVLTNDGSGGFGLDSTLGAGSYPHSVVAADVNGDGRPDLICANYGSGTLTVWTNSSSRTASFNGNGSGLTGVNAANLVGALATAQLPASVITNGASGVNIAGAFSGNGGNVTNVNATTLNGLTSSGFWGTNGNAGADPANGAFLGTTDNLPLEFRVNGQRALRLEPTASQATVNVIAGSLLNSVGAGVQGATIAGGGTGNYLDFGLTDPNWVESNFGTVSGGIGNNIQFDSVYATICGGFNNGIQTNASYTTIGGGWNNIIQANADDATIGGGMANTIESSARKATIGGGSSNIIQSNDEAAVIGGGFSNTIQTNSYEATIGGGGRNEIQLASDFAAIGGGYKNVIQPNAPRATIAGGSLNNILINSYTATIGGGDQNTAGGNYATVPGGVGNQAIGQFSLAAGHDAKALHDGTFVWADSPAGGFSSTGTNQFLIRASGGVGINNNNPNGAALAVIGDVTVEGIISANGFSAASATTPEVITPKISTSGNVPLEFYVNGQRALRLEPTASADSVNVISGSASNTVAPGVAGATIGGGGSGKYNRVEALYDTVAGGGQNTVQSGSSYATISGGLENIIQPNAAFSTIGGGKGNTNQLNADSTTISGGYRNTIQSYASAATIGGGFENTIQSSASSATIGGGDLNTAGGYSATVPGGEGNSASGQFSFAAGLHAKALHNGAFVWADSIGVDFASTADDQFCIRASGGVQLDPLTSQFFGSQTRQMLNLWGTSYGIGVQASSLYFRCDNSAGTDGFIWYKGGVHSDAYVDAGGGTELMHLIQGALYVNGTFVSASDRNLKENFKPVSAREMLDKVATLPISRWNYKQDTSSEHVGPMAQDFYAAFSVGPDDKHITVVDESGVALAAIQGLNQKLEAEAKAKDAEIESLKQNLAELKQLVQSLAEKK